MQRLKMALTLETRSNLAQLPTGVAEVEGVARFNVTILHLQLDRKVVVQPVVAVAPLRKWEDGYHKDGAKGTKVNEGVIFFFSFCPTLNVYWRRTRRK